VVGAAISVTRYDDDSPEGIGFGADGEDLVVHELPPRIHEDEIAPDGTYTIDGLEPGTWLIASSPIALAAGSPREVVVRASDLEIALDLVLAR
jgi:hypothetical protein